MSRERDKSSGLESNNPYVPKTSGWPTWNLEAEKILSGIRYWVQQGGHESHVAYLDFLRIFDLFLSQLIEWTEQTDLPQPREWAGRALADRLQFLSTQKGDWCSENGGFKKRWAEFADRRHARSPRSYLGWEAGDYLRRIMDERDSAALLLSPPPANPDSPVTLGKNVKVVKRDNAATIAELLNYSEERISYLKKLAALPDFSRESASQWGESVFERMQQDEQEILSSPQMRKCETRDSRERRRSGEVRLYDFKKTIVDAVIRLASKPLGHIRGITRPA